MLIGSGEDQLFLVDRRVDIDIHHGQRDVAKSRRRKQSADVFVTVKAKQREFRAERVLQGKIVTQPNVRGAASGNRRRREVEQRVSGRRGTVVVFNDRRILIEIAEVQSAAAKLPQVDIICFLTYPGARGIPLGSRCLDVVGITLRWRASAGDVSIA